MSDGPPVDVDDGGWHAVLDDYERCLVAVREATIAGDVAAVPPFVPPTRIGPMPESVVPRARALLLASRELEELLVQARSAVRARLDAPPPQAAAPRRASMLDARV